MIEPKDFPRIETESHEYTMRKQHSTKNKQQKIGVQNYASNTNTSTSNTANNINNLTKIPIKSNLNVGNILDISDSSTNHTNKNSTSDEKSMGYTGYNGLKIGSTNNLPVNNQYMLLNHKREGGEFNEVMSGENVKDSKDNLR